MKHMPKNMDKSRAQLLIKTSAGVWSVVYNAENRPIRWQSGDTVITMAFDRMGRRVEMRTVKNGEETRGIRKSPWQSTEDGHQPIHEELHV